MKIKIIRKIEFSLMLFILVTCYLLGNNIKQKRHIELLVKEKNTLLISNENFINSFKVNLLPLNYSYPDIIDTLRNKTFFFFDAHSCSSCDSTLRSISMIKDSVIIENVVVLFNNNLGKRGVQILRSKLSNNNMRIIELPDSVFYIKNSFLLQNINGQISNQYITLPFCREFIEEYFNYFGLYLKAFKEKEGI